MMEARIQQQLEAYIGLDHTTKQVCTRARLNTVISHYMLRVPFENLNVLNGVPIALDDDAMLRKIVDEGRGGFCYEQNRFFLRYLQSIGYEGYHVSATVNIPGRNQWAMTDSHMTSIITIDGQKYLVDVGFSDIPKCALPLPKAGRRDVMENGQTYAIRNIDADTYDLMRVDHGTETVLYRFVDKVKVLADFEAGITYHTTDPTAPFKQSLLVSKALKNGRMTMSHAHITIVRGQEVQKFSYDADRYPSSCKLIDMLDQLSVGE